MFDASQGTVLWGFNKFRSDALVELLNDLVDLEKVGLQDQKCSKVRMALRSVVDTVGSVSDQSWLKSFVWRDLKEFEQLYTIWNSHAGDQAPANRRDTLRQMRRRRNRLARKVRTNQLILSSELDSRLISDIYGSLEELSKSLPDAFDHLSLAVNRFQKLKER
jgi:hypothetical protein